MKCVGEFGAHAEWSLRSGPDRYLVAIPFRDRGPRLERCVRDIGYGVRLFEFLIGLRQTVVDGSLRTRAAPSTAPFTRRLPQKIKQLGVRRLTRTFPVCSDNLGGIGRGLLIRRRDAHKIAVTHTLNSRN